MEMESLYVWIIDERNTGFLYKLRRDQPIGDLVEDWSVKRGISPNAVNLKVKRTNREISMYDQYKEVNSVFVNLDVLIVQ